MWSQVERTPNAMQVPPVVVGTVLTVIYGRQLPALTPPIDQVPPSAVSAHLYDWSTVQFGLAVVVIGLALSNRSVFHRVRLVRLSRVQRLAAFACALALALPWVTAVVAGVALGFSDPFTAIWFAAFALGFVGAAGLLLLGAHRVAQLSLTTSGTAPSVAVDASRRAVVTGVGAAVLGGATVVTAFGAGRVTLGDPPPEYHGRAPVVYERDDLRVLPVDDPARIGESITFEITNTATAEAVTLGCHVPWALQAYEDGDWRHVSWTEGRYYQACATVIEPGVTTTVTVPLSAEAIADEAVSSGPATDLTPGTYRLVLLGTDPYLAVNFQALPSD